MVSKKYFDDEGHQLRQLPKKWMDPSRFKIGQKVIIFDLSSYLHGGKNIEGIIVELHPGYGSWPPRIIRNKRGGIEDGQYEGWLVVELPFIVSTNYANGKLQENKKIALGLDNERHTWRLKC